MLNVEWTRLLIHSTLNIQHSSSSSVLEPPSGKPRPTQSAHNVRVLLHLFPHQPASIILNHGDDRSLIDAEVVDVEPAVRVCGIEGVGESIFAIEIRSVPLLHRFDRRDGNFRSERN